jgi:hypothetical protein
MRRDIRLREAQKVVTDFGREVDLGWLVMRTMTTIGNSDLLLVDLIL